VLGALPDQAAPPLPASRPAGSPVPRRIPISPPLLSRRRGGVARPSPRDHPADYPAPARPGAGHRDRPVVTASDAHVDTALTSAGGNVTVVTRPPCARPWSAPAGWRRCCWAGHRCRARPARAGLGLMHGTSLGRPAVRPGDQIGITIGPPAATRLTTTPVAVVPSSCEVGNALNPGFHGARTHWKPVSWRSSAVPERGCRVRVVQARSPARCGREAAHTDAGNASATAVPTRGRILTAWLPRSCSSSDMAEATMSYQQAGPGSEQG
jgi:hypothetical protein